MKKSFVGLGEGAPSVGMSAAVRFGDFIAVSGQVALDERGELVGKGDFTAQANQCFANLAKVLARAGGSLKDVVSLTAYLTSAAHAQQFLSVRAQHFPVEPPATTTVVAQLLGADFLIEIQALAAVSTVDGER